MQVDRLITEYHWGVIHNRPGLDPKSEGHLRPGIHDGVGPLRPADSPPH